MPFEQCKSEYKGLRCDVKGTAPHTHHSFLDKNSLEDIDEHLWWSDADTIAELKEKFENLLESNPDLTLT